MISLLLLSVLTPSQVGDSTRATDPVLLWNEVALNAIREARTPPPLAARNLAILHGAIYDTVNTIDKRSAHFRVNLVTTEPVHLEAAIHAAGARVLKELYPKQASTFDRSLQKALEAIPTSRPRSLALGVGRYMADEVLAWRRGDGHERSTTYIPGKDEGVWRPTPPNYDNALLPGYGRVVKLGLSEKFDPKYVPPPALDSAEFRDDLIEVRILGGMDSTQRTAEQTLIAHFWNDGPGTCTPPGHWNLIARIVSIQQKFDTVRNAHLFALLNLGLADAAIVCWDCKYRYRLWRPITAIRRSTPDWTSLLNTPAFPSYTSGHSTFSGAAATILAEVMGKDGVEFTVGSDGVPGAERSYRGFWEAAREAGRSRVYGGIHYECDNREGLSLGKRVAEDLLATRLSRRMKGEG